MLLNVTYSFYPRLLYSIQYTYISGPSTIFKMVAIFKKTLNKGEVFSKSNKSDLQALKSGSAWFTYLLACIVLCRCRLGRCLISAYMIPFLLLVTTQLAVHINKYMPGTSILN